MTADNLRAAIDANVHQHARLMTDELPAYRAIAEQTGREHHAVVHSPDEYVRSEAHVNTAEGFFSLLKRGINGTFHHVSRGHLNRYCDEFAFRYENQATSKP